jgi:hypothetical protein
MTLSGLRSAPLASSLFQEVDQMHSRVATRSAVVAIALAGTALAFVVGAHAGAILNGRVMAISVAHVPMPVVASPQGSPVTGHVR